MLKDTLKKVIIGIISAGIIVSGTTAILFATGKIGNKYEATVEKEHIDIQRDNFKHSKSYVEGKISDLAKYKREYEKTKDKSEKESIVNLINTEYANFDIKQIENKELREFLSDIRSGLK